MKPNPWVALVLFLSGVALATYAGCGGTYRVEVPPVEVNVNHSISFGDVLSAFRVQCRKELGPDATEQEVESCAQVKLADLLAALEEALGS